MARLNGYAAAISSRGEMDRRRESSIDVDEREPEIVTPSNLRRQIGYE